MTVMGEASRERRTIVEGVRFSTFGQFDLPLECFDLSPSLQHNLLLFWEVDRHICGVLFQVSLDTASVGGDKCGDNFSMSHSESVITCVYASIAVLPYIVLPQQLPASWNLIDQMDTQVNIRNLGCYTMGMYR